MKVCIKSGIECNFYKHYYKNSSPCLGCDDNIMSNFQPKEENCLDCVNYGSPECRVHGKQCIGYKLKETKMEKVQMTEDEANDIFSKCVLEHNSTTRDGFISRMKKNGYIKKSELQTLVDEAELLYKAVYNPDSVHIKLLQAIEALKKSHLEFKE